MFDFGMWNRGTGLVFPGQKGTVHVSCCCPRTTAGHMNRPLLSSVKLEH